MGNTGFDTSFNIHRKRNIYALQFLMFLRGQHSNAGTWPDDEDTAIDPTVTTAQLAPFGYLPDGNDFLTGNLGVNADTITQFSIMAVIVRNDRTQNESVVYGLFGSTHYPRIYFVGAALHAEIKLGGTVRSIVVSNSNTYIGAGFPHLIVFRGDAAVGIELLIDGVSVGTDSNTGASFDVGSGDFLISKDSNLSYFQQGNIRHLAVIDAKLTDGQLSLYRSMLEYEGCFDLWHDDFKKWSGTATMEVGVTAFPSSPYLATFEED